MFKTLSQLKEKSNKDIRLRIAFTLFGLAIFILGTSIRVPGTSNLTSDLGFLELVNTMGGGALKNFSIFALGVTPYITASIIMQLLTVAIPPLERLAQEGEEGQRKIAKYTRFATVILGLIQGTAYWWWLSASGYLQSNITSGFDKTFAAIVIILCFTAGSALMMWHGERIDEKGIGNGISLLLFAGIISRLPSGINTLITLITKSEEDALFKNWLEVIILLIIFAVVIIFVVWMQFAERRIPIQYAKRVVGRKEYGGQN